MRALIRPADLSEHQKLEEIQRRASLANPGDRESLLANPDAIEVARDQLEAGRTFVAATEEGIVGFATLTPRDDRNVDLDGLFVEPDQWSQGIGRALVNHCKLIAKMTGSQMIYVVANPHAEGFYRNCGFEATGIEPTRFGPGIVMQLKL